MLKKRAQHSNLGIPNLSSTAIFPEKLPKTLKFMLHVYHESLRSGYSIQRFLKLCVAEPLFISWKHETLCFTESLGNTDLEYTETILDLTVHLCLNHF